MAELDQMSSMEFTYWQAFFLVKNERENPKNDTKDSKQDDEDDED